MPSIFDTLREIERIPVMYLPYTDDQRDKQMICLEHFISGYSFAIRQHGINGPVNDFREDFGRFLRKKYGWSMSQGPIFAILKTHPDGESAWRVFWTNVWEFERSLTTN